MAHHQFCNSFLLSHRNHTFKGDRRYSDIYLPLIMSFANFDPCKAPPRSQQTNPQTISIHNAGSSPSSGTSAVQSSSNSHINQISDAIVQYSSNVDLLDMLSQQSQRASETELQYNVQLDVTSQLCSRVVSHMGRFSSTLSSGTLPRTEAARLRSTLVKLEKVRGRARAGAKDGWSKC